MKKTRKGGLETRPYKATIRGQGVEKPVFELSIHTPAGRHEPVGSADLKGSLQGGRDMEMGFPKP